MAVDAGTAVGSPRWRRIRPASVFCSPRTAARS